MKKGKFQSGTRHIRGSARSIALILAVMLLVGGVVGGTVAWLVDESNEVVNTFTYGDINIKLDETTPDENGKATEERTTEGNEYEMVPGRKLLKDPVVTVRGDSEACWLFVKIEESGDIEKFLTYAIAEGWTKLEDGVYYREVKEAEKNADGKQDDQKFYILAGNEEHPNGIVTVKGSITKEQLNALDSAEQKPALSFTAYAVQKDNIPTPADAWKIAQDPDYDPSAEVESPVEPEPETPETPETP